MNLGWNTLLYLNFFPPRLLYWIWDLSPIGSTWDHYEGELFFLKVFSYLLPTQPHEKVYNEVNGMSHIFFWIKKKSGLGELYKKRDHSLSPFKALEHLREFEIGRIFFKRFYLPTWRLEKVYNKINGTLGVLLSTRELGGGLQKALTLVECSWEQLRVQENSK